MTRGERNAYPKLFTRQPEYGAPHARIDARMEDRVQIALTFDQNLLKYVPTVIRSIEANSSQKTEYHLLVRGLSDDDMRNVEKTIPGSADQLARYGRTTSGCRIPRRR